MTRREVRDSAFKIIYQSLLRDDTAEELFEAAVESEEIPVNDEVKLMVNDVLAKAAQLDEMIAKFSKKRALARIAKINVAILRIAFYEILYNDRIPTNAAIKEAVVLAQSYSQKEDVAFINGVLGAYSRSLGEDSSQNEGK